MHVELSGAVAASAAELFSLLFAVAFELATLSLSRLRRRSFAVYWQHLRWPLAPALEMLSVFVSRIQLWQRRLRRRRRRPRRQKREHHCFYFDGSRGRGGELKRLAAA